MPFREDVKAVFIELDDGTVLEYDGADITVKEDLTYAENEKDRVRYMTILIHLTP